MGLGGDLGMGFDRWVEVCGSGLRQGGGTAEGEPEELEWWRWENRNCPGGRRRGAESWATSELVF